MKYKITATPLKGDVLICPVCGYRERTETPFAFWKCPRPLEHARIFDKLNAKLDGFKTEGN